MSKIYEALRQAELDRAKAGSQPGHDLNIPATSQAVLDNDQDAFFSGASRAAIPISPSPRPSAVDLADRNTFGETASDRVTSSSLDLSQVKAVRWEPSLIQLPALEHRGSAVEQFRSLRSRMQEFRDLNSLKTLMVSSGLPQEGKSFVTANLAVSFARHKAGRVLLIDGDMRRATLHKLIGAPQGPGLTDYLSGKASIEEVMQRPLADDTGSPIPAGLASLTFIPAGLEHDKAADLSGNQRFSQLIKEVSPHFDWIVVDSSPVNLVSDGVNLARFCDAVLLVARGGVTKYEVAQRAIAELKASKVLGIVLNAVKNPPASGGYYGYDGYDGYDKVEE